MAEKLLSHTKMNSTKGNSGIKKKVFAQAKALVPHGSTLMCCTLEDSKNIR
jgi:hypothetical protein